MVERLYLAHDDDQKYTSDQQWSYNVEGGEQRNDPSEKRPSALFTRADPASAKDRIQSSSESTMTIARIVVHIV